MYKGLHTLLFEDNRTSPSYRGGTTVIRVSLVGRIVARCRAQLVQGSVTIDDLNVETEDHDWTEIYSHPNLQSVVPRYAGGVFLRNAA